MKYRKHIIFFVVMLGIIVTQISIMEKNKEAMAIKSEKNVVEGIAWVNSDRKNEEELDLSKGSIYQKQIANEILRFHILANSDTNLDQQVKLKMKDIVVKKVQELLKNTKTKEEAKTILKKNLKEIEAIVKEGLKKEGMEETVTAEIEKRVFPVKIYGDMIFPAGEYEALDVKLGEAKGKNWWCVMYPSLCLIDGTYQVVPDEAKSDLEEKLEEKTFRLLIDDKQEMISKINEEEDKNTEEALPVEYHFQLWDWITGSN